MKRILVLLVLLLTGCQAVNRYEAGSAAPDPTLPDVSVAAYDARADGYYWIDDAKTLYGFGSNNMGQLGNGKREELETQYAYSEPVKIAEHVKQVSSSIGGRFVLYVDEQNRLYGIGENNDGEMLQAPAESDRVSRIACVTRPKLLMENVRYASAGSDHVLAITTDNRLWAWGGNANGQLGDGSARAYGWDTPYHSDDQPYSAEPIPILEGAAFAAAGHLFSGAVKTDGTLWTWGDNALGEIGNGESGNGLPTVSDLIVNAPVQVMEGIEMVWADRRQLDEHGLLPEEYAQPELPLELENQPQAALFARSGGGALYGWGYQCGADVSLCA